MSEHDTHPLGPEGSYYEDQARKEAEERRRKSDAMFPILITGLYLVLGFFFGLWHPGWMVFLTIPLHYMRPKNNMEKLTNPVMIVLIYLVLGFFFKLWHPGWLIFFAIPLGAIANGSAKH